MKYNTRWDELYELIRKNALAGKDKISLEFFLVDKIDVLEDDIEDIKDMIDTSVEFFAIQHNMKLDEAKKMFHSNIRYIVGYYGKERAEKWRDLLESYRE